MSDFKPGDKEYCTRGTRCTNGVIGHLCAIHLTGRCFRTRDLVKKPISGFFSAKQETPGGVCGFGVARQLKLIRRRF